MTSRSERPDGRQTASTTIGRDRGATGQPPLFTLLSATLIGSIQLEPLSFEPHRSCEPTGRMKRLEGVRIRQRACRLSL